MTVAGDDDLWSAVGDPTRRRILGLLLTEGPASATGLSRRLPVTRQAVARHLALLEKVGLVRSATAGRQRTYRVHEQQLARAAGRLSLVGAAWDVRLKRIDALAATFQRRKERNAGQNP